MRRKSKIDRGEAQSFLFSFFPSFKCRNLMAVYVFLRLPRECSLPSCIRHKGLAFVVKLWVAIGYTYLGCAYLLFGSPEIWSVHYWLLHSMVIPCFLDLLSVIFQQDSAKTHVPHHVLTLYGKQCIQLLHWSARSFDLSPIETIWSCIAQSLFRRHN